MRQFHRPHASELTSGNIRPALGFTCALLLGLLAAGSAAAAEDGPRRRVLVDFEDAQAVKLSPAGMEVRRVAGDTGQALEIASQADAAYPGVTIEPRAGKWDLSGFEAVEMEVRNLDDVPVRVLLSVNNPGADGRQHCNTEAGTIGAQGKGKVVVPFGMWHGDPGHDLDLTNIVSLHILLDQPKRAHRFVVDNLRAVTADRQAGERAMADPFFRELQPVFGRGINLGNALEAPIEGEWGVTLQEHYFQDIKAAGFQSVRIPVRWSAHAAKTAPYTIDPAFFGRVDWAVDQALKQRLEVVLNMHHYEEIMREPAAHRERFLALWRQIAAHYKDRPAALALELLNEPNGNLAADVWNRLAAEGIAVVRRTNPTRWIVVGPGSWNSINELASLELPEADRRIMVTFHYYSPFQFTHQGASWTGAEANKWLGTKWTGTEKEQQAIRSDFDKALAWGVEQRRPMYLGEFGALNTADMESRARWTRFVADEAVKRKFGFGYWEFCSGFGAYDPGKNEWIEPLEQALLGK